MKELRPVVALVGMDVARDSRAASGSGPRALDLLIAWDRREPSLVSAGVLNASSSYGVEAAVRHGARASAIRRWRAASPRAWAFRLVARKVRHPHRKRLRWRRA